MVFRSPEPNRSCLRFFCKGSPNLNNSPKAIQKGESGKVLCARCQVGKNNRESGSGSGFGVEKDCGGFDTDSDSDGEPRKDASFLLPPIVTI